MYELKGEDLIPGLTMAEIKKSRLPLPDRESLDDEEREIFDTLLARSKRFFESVPANAGQEYRLTPYFQGLLQSPRVAKLWANFGDFYQPAEKRGSFTHRDRELAELTVGMLLKLLTGTRSLPAIHVADAIGVGLAASDIQAIYEDRLEDLSPADRQLAEYVRATVQGQLTPELFDALAERIGRKFNRVHLVHLLSRRRHARCASHVEDPGSREKFEARRAGAAGIPRRNRRAAPTRPRQQLGELDPEARSVSGPGLKSLDTFWKGAAGSA